MTLLVLLRLRIEVGGSIGRTLSSSSGVGGRECLAVSGRLGLAVGLDLDGILSLNSGLGASHFKPTVGDTFSQT